MQPYSVAHLVLQQGGINACKQIITSNQKFDWFIKNVKHFVLQVFHDPCQCNDGLVGDGNGWFCL